MQDALKRCMVHIKPSALKKLTAWTQDTTAEGQSGWDALGRKYESCALAKSQVPRLSGACRHLCDSGEMCLVRAQH